MSRETFVWDPERGVIPKSEAVQRPASRTHGIIRDFTDPVLCPADGRHYHSKRQYERAVAREGCVVVGNEKISHVERNRPRLDSPAPDIARAMEQLGR